MDQSAAPDEELAEQEPAEQEPAEQEEAEQAVDVVPKVADGESATADAAPEE